MMIWEYQTLVAKGNQDGMVVWSVDGDKTKTVIGRPQGLFGGDQYIPLHKYLALVGIEGWEVVGVSPISDAGETGGPILTLIILKRATSSSQSTSQSSTINTKVCTACGTENHQNSRYCVKCGGVYYKQLIFCA